jgi:hypothetical protein
MMTAVGTVCLCACANALEHSSPANGSWGHPYIMISTALSQRLRCSQGVLGSKERMARLRAYSVWKRPALVATKSNEMKIAKAGDPSQVFGHWRVARARREGKNGVPHTSVLRVGVLTLLPCPLLPCVASPGDDPAIIRRDSAPLPSRPSLRANLRKSCRAVRTLCLPFSGTLLADRHRRKSTRSRSQWSDGCRRHR